MPTNEQYAAIWEAGQAAYAKRAAETWGKDNPDRWVKYNERIQDLLATAGKAAFEESVKLMQEGN